MERERKFLVAKPPGGLARFPHRRIRQGYLAIPDGDDKTSAEVRVRDEGGKHVLAVKQGRGQLRQEIEVPVRPRAFAALWRLTQGKRLEKVRYRIPQNGLTMELDVYHGKLRGLMTAEIEFDSNRQLRAFRPPPWLGREVTGRDEFSNSRLATRGKPRAARKR